MRKYFIDNIRWATVIAVLVYHVFYNFNAAGVLGGVGSFSEVQYQDIYLYAVYPWFMMLLFIVAGISSRYALDKKSPKEFINSRTLKLLVPSTIGLFVFQWILGYVNTRSAGDGLNSMPGVAKYFLYAFTGVGPLWFIQDLWVYSLLIVLIRKCLPGNGIKSFFEETPVSDCRCGQDERCTKRGYCMGKYVVSMSLVLVGGFLLLWGASQSQINSISMSQSMTPSIAQSLFNGYRPLFYFVPFLMGYYVLSLESVQTAIKRLYLPLLVLAIVGCVAYVITYFGKDYTSPSCLQSVETNLYAWVMILAIFACSMKWADKTSKIATYMTRSSFGIYVVHMVICTSSCYYLKQTSLPIWSIYLICLTSTLALSPCLYELIRRIPFVRWCVLGIKKNR